jgi:rhamnose transport system permease protein
MAALSFIARRNTAKADIGSGMELDVITAVVLGGASIFGGRGRIIGALLGLALLHELRQFVSWRYHNDELISILTGVLLISSVLLNTLLSPSSRRR